MAVVVLGSTVLHCVDFDHPYWYRPEAVRDGIVPSAEHFVADAILALASSEVRMAPLNRRTAGLDGHVFPAPDATNEHLVAARRAVYESGTPGLLHIAIGTPEHLIAADLLRFAMPTFTTVLQGSAEALRP